MTGNQDRAARAQARRDQIYARLDPMLDTAMDALDESAPTKGDTLGVQRYLRCVDLAAKAARSVVALIDPPGRGRGAKPAEDDMTDDDRDDSPETLDRLRAELESRLDRLHALIEEKRVDCLAGGGRGAWGGGEPLRAA